MRKKLKEKSKKNKPDGLPYFDKGLLLEALRKSAGERLREACELYERFALLTPYKFRPIARSFGSFKEYEQWKKTQKDPRYW